MNETSRIAALFARQGPRGPFVAKELF